MFNTPGIFTARRRAGISTSVTIVGTSATAVFGTAPAGATVTLARGGTTLGTATADGAGVWSYTPGTAPAPGDVYTASAPVSSASYTIPPVAVSISGAPGAATVGTAYSFTPTVTNGSGTRSFSISGSLPAGLSFSSTTGAISGTPSAAGTAGGISVTVTDATGSATLSGLSIAVAASAPPFAAPSATRLSTKTFRPGGTTGGTNLTHATILASDAPFTGGVIHVYNTTATAQTIGAVSVAPSAVENDGYNPLNGAGAAQAWTDVSAGTFTVPAATVAGSNGVPGVLAIPFTCASIPRTDNAAWPHLLMVRLVGVTALTPGAPTAAEMNAQATAFSGRRPVKGYWKAGNFVASNKAGFTAPTQAFVAPLDVTFTTTVPGKTVLFAGDSTHQGATSASNYLSYGVLACDSLSTLMKPVAAANCGFQGQTLAQSIATARAYIAAMSPSHVCIPVYSVNDADHSQAGADAAYALALGLAADCAASGIVPILVTPLPASSLTLANDNVRKVIVARAKTNVQGYACFDYDAVFTDGASPARLNATASSSDGTHPTTYSAAATAFAAQFGATLTA